MLARFQQFARERQMLMGVSPATLSWYKYSLMWLNTESPSQNDLNDAVCRMREKGLKATGCNSAIRAINAYLKWSGSANHIKMKEPQIILPTFTSAQVKLLDATSRSPFTPSAAYLPAAFVMRMSTKS